MQIFAKIQVMDLLTKCHFDYLRHEEFNWGVFSI